MSLATMLTGDFTSTLAADWGTACTYTHSGLTGPVSCTGIFSPAQVNTPLPEGGRATVRTLELVSTELLDGATPVVPERAGTVVDGSTTWTVREVENTDSGYMLTIVTDQRGVP